MPETFGERLRLAMEKKGWNQTMLAAESTITPGAVSRHLEQEHAPKPDTLEKYRAALGVNVEWLGYGRGQMNARAEATSSLAGSEALERVLAAFDWPDIDIAIIDAVCDDARKEAFSNGKDRPESAWHLRVKQLLRERTGTAKEVHKREPAERVDLTQKSPELRGHTKKSRRA